MDVKLPPLGEGADSGVVVNLFVKVGDAIAKDQPLLELENEKAVATIPSSTAGTVTQIYVKPGDKLNVGQRILSVDSGSGGSAKTTPAQPAAKRPAAAQQPEPEMSDSEAELPSRPDGEAAASDVAASPAIRKLARDLGIDLTRVRGTGRGGRVQMEDVRAYIQRLQKSAAQPRPAVAGSSPASPAPESIDFSKWGPVTKQPLTSLRQVIARRMLENWNTIPHVTQFDEADITRILELRKKRLAEFEKKGARLTVTAFVVKALVASLKKHPIFNASLDEASQSIVFKNYYDIGIAVDTEAGLIVPVLRDADKKDLAQIARDLEELAGKARDRKVSAEELKGGTFTISNQGGIGSAHFTPIVNKPEVAILGLGKAAAKPVVRDGKVEIRTMMPLGLSYDHRVIDGGAAARFMVDLVAGLEDWSEGSSG